MTCDAGEKICFGAFMTGIPTKYWASADIASTPAPIAASSVMAIQSRS
jgi:hypothetical protein